MTGTNCDLFTHKSSRSYLNHLVLQIEDYCVLGRKRFSLFRLILPSKIFLFISVYCFIMLKSCSAVLSCKTICLNAYTNYSFSKGFPVVFKSASVIIDVDGIPLCLCKTI
jgi:hypothetical protein